MLHKLTHEELLARQKNTDAQKLPFTVVLNHIRSLYNVGSIFRTCDGLGVEKLWLCGITGTPQKGTGNNSCLSPFAAKQERERIEKTALGAEKTVPWEHAFEILPVLRNLKELGYQIVLLEQTKESIPYQEFEPKSPICLVVGNEITGISNELLAFSDAAIEIGMAGTKNSLNVAVAFGIVAYQIRSRLCVLSQPLR